MDPITRRRWQSFDYTDPAGYLRRFRAVERELTDRLRGVDPDVLALRTDELNRFRELRSAALFTYGMGLALGARIDFADEEDEDYDFMTKRVDGDTDQFCPVQLKELPPADRNAELTVEGLLGDLPTKYGPTETVLAVRLSRAGQVNLDRDWPRVPFAQLWFFWASAPDSAEFSIYGDALETPRQWAFDYPE